MTEDVSSVLQEHNRDAENELREVAMNMADITLRDLQASLEGPHHHLILRSLLKRLRNLTLSKDKTSLWLRSHPSARRHAA